MKLYNCFIKSNFNGTTAFAIQVLGAHNSDAHQIYCEFLDAKGISFGDGTVNIEEAEVLTRNGFATMNVDSVNYTIKGTGLELKRN